MKPLQRKFLCKSESWRSFTEVFGYKITVKHKELKDKINGPYVLAQSY